MYHRDLSQNPQLLILFIQIQDHTSVSFSLQWSILFDTIYFIYVLASVIIDRILSDCVYT